MAARWIFALALCIPIACSAQTGAPPPEANAPQATQPTSPSASPQGQPGTSQSLPQQHPSAGSGAPPPAQGEIDGKLQVFVYPAKGQSPAQQSQDEQECFGWAQSSAANQSPPNTSQDSATQQKSGAPVAGGSAKGAPPALRSGPLLAMQARAQPLEPPVEQWPGCTTAGKPNNRRNNNSKHSKPHNSSKLLTRYAALTALVWNPRDTR